MTSDTTLAGNVGSDMTLRNTADGKQLLMFSLNISTRKNSNQKEGWVNCATSNPNLINNMLNSKFSRGGAKNNASCPIKGARVLLSGRWGTKWTPEYGAQMTFWANDLSFSLTFYPLTISAPARQQAQTQAQDPNEELIHMPFDDGDEPY